MPSTRLRFAVLAGVFAALLIGASLTASAADARSFDASDQTLAKAQLDTPDDGGPTFEKRGGPKPKRPKPGRPSWAGSGSNSGKGNGPPSWAPAGRRASSTFDISTLGRSDGRSDRDDSDGQSEISNRTSTIVDGDFIWPVAGRRLTTRFSRRHDGIDIGVSYVAVSAAADGEVVFAGGNSRSGYGRYIEVQHADGYLTRYAHLSRLSVRVGDRVVQGEVIATSGDTGYSTGPHLHFELHLDGSAVDPLRYLP